MYQADYKGINAFLKCSCELLLNEGKKRIINGKICYELPEPYMFKIENPTARLVTIPQRKWFVTLPYAESLWLASGKNDMAFIRHYLPRMDDFSDDKIFMRGGYGPRLRHFNNDRQDYRVNYYHCELLEEVDQFRYVIECFKEDISTRRAVVTIGDPNKDDFNEKRNLKQTLDIPCTRMLHFIKDPEYNKLNMVVSMRSNDLIWGASAVNIFNFTFMQEYFASMLGMEIGSYFHIANNFHFYEDKLKIVESIANSNITDDDIPFEYNKTFSSLQEFDSLVKTLNEEEIKMRIYGSSYKYLYIEDSFFRDWYNVLYVFNTHRTINFINPVLNSLIHGV